MLDYIHFPDQIERVDYAMIGLHGRNANKYAFFPFVRQMGFLHTRWLLPSATFAREGAEDTRWWFDNAARPRREILQSRELVNELIDMQVDEGIPPENIFLIGFSQGAVMAVETGLRYPRRLGGIVSLSGYVTHPELLGEERHTANLKLPIFLAHGTRDSVLTIDVGRENHRVLEGLGYAVEYREYDTQHRISSHETKDIRSFLHRHMYGMFMDDPRSADDHVVVF